MLTMRCAKWMIRRCNAKGKGKRSTSKLQNIWFDFFFIRVESGFWDQSWRMGSLTFASYIPTENRNALWKISTRSTNTITIVLLGSVQNLARSSCIGTMLFPDTGYFSSVGDVQRFSAFCFLRTHSFVGHTLSVPDKIPMPVHAANKCRIYLETL